MANGGGHMVSPLTGRYRACSVEDTAASGAVERLTERLSSTASVENGIEGSNEIPGELNGDSSDRRYPLCRSPCSEEIRWGQLKMI